MVKKIRREGEEKKKPSLLKRERDKDENETESTIAPWKTASNHHKPNGIEKSTGDSQV